MNLLKKLFVYSVVITTVLWSVGASFAPLAANAAGSYPAGSLLAMKGQSGAAVYLIGTDAKKYVFPSQKEYFTWYPNFDKVVRVAVAELDMYPDGGAVTVRPGTKLVTHANTAKVYAIEPGGILRWIPTDTIAKALYGNNWTSRLVDVIPGFFSSSYKATGADISDKYAKGTVVKMGTTYYYIDGTSKRAFANDAALTANGYVAADAVAVTALTGYTDGTSITGAESAIKDFTPTEGGTIPVLSGSVNVSLAASNPASGTVIVDNSGTSQAQALANFGAFNFTAASDGAALVKTVKFTRSGVSADADVDTLYLFDGATRVAEGGSISAGVVTFNNPAGLFTVAAGTTKTISLKADIGLTATAGKTISFGIDTAADVVTGGTVSGSFPARGNLMTVATVSDLGGLKVATSTPSTAATSIDPNQTDAAVAAFTLTAEDQKLSLEKLVLTETGSIQVGDLTGFKLLVDGNQIATAEMASDYTLTFNLTTPLEILSGNSKVFSVRANIIKGATRTFYFSFQYRSDIVAKDVNYGVYVWPRNQYVTNGTWSILKPTGYYTISQGAVTVNKSTTSPATSVSVDSTNLTLAKFDFKATGEDMKIKDLNVSANTVSALAGGNGGLDNGKVFVDGVQVGSTKDLTEDTAVNFTFGSSFVIPAGTTKVVSIVADTKSTTGQSYATAVPSITITLTTGSSNGQGMSSLQTSNVPSGASGVAGNTLTTSASSLSVTKYSGYGNQTMLAGTPNAKVGSFVISTGATAGVNLTSITVNLSAGEAATVTNLLIKRNDTGVQFGTTKGAPGESNVFNGTVNIPAASLVIFDLYADINSGAQAGPWIASLDASGTSSVDGNTVSDSGDTVQTITLGNGSLTLSAGTQPDSINIIAGTSGNTIGQFRLNAANTAYTINNLNLNFPNNFATSTSAVTIEYPKADGTTGTMTSVIEVGTASTLYAAFAGVGMYVAKDTEALVNVKVSLATIASGATAGALGTVTFDPDTNFQAVNTSGTVSTDVGSTEYTGNNFYVRKSVPTFARVSTGTTTPLTDEPIFKFTVVADSAGTIDIKQLGFTVTTTGVTVTALKLYNSSSNTALTDTGLDPDSSGFVKLLVGAVDNDVLTISTTPATYDVRGTIAGWGNSGDVLSVRFKEDVAVIATPTAGAYVDDSATLRLAQYNVWSDRAASSHTTITTDWTNGFLLKNMTGTQEFQKA